MVCSERFLERSRQHYSVNHFADCKTFGKVDTLQRPCAGRAEAANPVLGNNVVVPERNLGHQRALRGRLLSNWARVVQLIFDGNLDELCSCPVPLMLGTFFALGSTLFRGRVRIYARMRVAAQLRMAAGFEPAD